MAPVSEKDMEANKQSADDPVRKLVSRLRRFGPAAILLSVMGCLLTALCIYLLAFGSDTLGFDSSNNDTVLLLLKWILMGLCLMLLGVPFKSKIYGKKANGRDVIYVISWTVVNIATFFVLAFFAVHPSTFLHKESNEHSVPANQSNDPESCRVPSHECSAFLLTECLRFPVMVFSLMFGGCLIKIAFISSQDGKIPFSFFTSGKIFTLVYSLCAIVLIIDPIVSWMLKPTSPFVVPANLTSQLSPKTEILTRRLLQMNVILSYAFIIFLSVSIARSGIQNWKRVFAINIGFALHIATWASMADHLQTGAVCFEKEYLLSTLPELPYRNPNFTILDIVLVVSCFAAVGVVKHTLTRQPTETSSAKQQRWPKHL